MKERQKRIRSIGKAAGVLLPSALEIQKKS
jgi:hypothetical protein